jgi:hypothetical protein
VTAVIQNNIRRSKFVDDLLEKVQVALIAYSNGDLVLFHHFARGIDVNTDNLSKWAEIAFPQLERAALADADFDKCCRAVPEPAKVLLVNWKIMGPLVNFSAVIREKH